ncbi:hypothetical protein F751_4220 [Auxenochlorella protothecoides]|uniref:Uncharacterized protein n=2 Tax=Auxenochlorella protothecoides TaxID=3075 RepID=A0A087SA22_AUXPR|nr:hypothetical protein F751_4220 [Auxenochlorella protothecoides]KFM22576.1 hypothetical protein F751_4220 [Auxenochlorella protothecoides]
MRDLPVFMLFRDGCGSVTAPIETPLHDAAAKKSHDGQSPIVDGAFTESGMLARVAVKRSGIHPK